MHTVYYKNSIIKCLENGTQPMGGVQYGIILHEMARVVVTGIGAVSPLGNTFSKSWAALKTGQSGIGATTRFKVSELPWKTSGELQGFDPSAYFSHKETRRLDSFVMYGVAAAMMAVEDSGLGSVDASLCNLRPTHPSAGVIIGSSRGGISTLEKEVLRLANAFSRTSPYAMPSSTVSMAASYAAQKLGLRGHCLGISNACASGTSAVGEAFRIIKSGSAPVVLAGGAEAPLCRLCIAGYGSVGALSRRPVSSGELPGTPRPFDCKRDGFVLSEGACVLVLEKLEHAEARGAKTYGEIVGYGSTVDAFDMTRPDSAGEARAIVAAIDEAGISPHDVSYINTHGTGTLIGDLAEGQSIKEVFGKRAPLIYASATKSMTGHMLAASGSIEAAFTLMALKETVIPPTINIDERDPACDVNIVTEKRTADLEFAVSSSFGFGGVNAVLVLRRL